MVDILKETRNLLFSTYKANKAYKVEEKGKEIGFDGRN